MQPMPYRIRWLLDVWLVGLHPMHVYTCMHAIDSIDIAISATIYHAVMRDYSGTLLM